MEPSFKAVGKGEVKERERAHPASSCDGGQRAHGTCRDVPSSVSGSSRAGRSRWLRRSSDVEIEAVISAEQPSHKGCLDRSLRM